MKIHLEGEYWLKSDSTQFMLCKKGKDIEVVNSKTGEITYKENLIPFRYPGSINGVLKALSHQLLLDLETDNFADVAKRVDKTNKLLKDIKDRLGETK